MKMKYQLPIHIKIKALSSETLFRDYAPVEVLGYCQGCGNYGKNHSCPGGEVEGQQLLEGYTRALLLVTEVDTAAFSSEDSELAAILPQLPLASQVYTDFRESHPEIKDDLYSRVSMYVFNQVKDLVGDRLMLAEARIPDSLCLKPGACTLCGSCIKRQGLPCAHPEQLRYSLESLGFKVSDLLLVHFDIPMTWSKDQFPEAFRSVSAFMSREAVDEEALMDLFQGLYVTIEA